MNGPLPMFGITLPLGSIKSTAESAVKLSSSVSRTSARTLTPPALVTPEAAQSAARSDPIAPARNYRIIIPLAVGFLIIAAAAIWFYQRGANRAWAREQIPRIEALAKLQKYFEAFDLATKTQEYLPDNPAIARLMPAISDAISVTTEPAGATVFLRRFKPDAAGKSPPREKVGSTPINGLRVAPYSQSL